MRPRRRWRSVAGALLPVIVSTSCADAPEGAREAELPTWRTTLELRVGSIDDPNQALSHVDALAVSDRGWIYIAQAREGAFRIYDGSGRFVRSVGGSGRGPDEFNELHAIGFLGDTLYAIDRYPPKVTFYTLEGELLGSEPRAVTIDWVPFPIGPDLLLPSGRAVATLDSPPGDERFDRTTMLFGPSGEFLDTLFVRRVAQVGVRNGNAMYSAFHRFPQRPVGFLSPDGGRFVTVEWDEPTGGLSTFTLTHVETEGDTIFSRAYRYTPVPRPRERVDSIVEALTRLLQERTGVSRRAASAAVRDQLRDSKHEPPVGYIAHSWDAELWVHSSNGGREPPGRWEVFDRRGDRIATVEFETPATPLLIRADQLWGLEYDEFSTPYIVRHRIHRN